MLESLLEAFICCLRSRTTFSLSESPSDVDVVSSSEHADEIISSWEEIISSPIPAASPLATHSNSSSLTHTRTGLIYEHLISTTMYGLCGVTVEHSLVTQKVAGRISAGLLPVNSLRPAAHMHVPLSLSGILVPAYGQ